MSSVILRCPRVEHASPLARHFKPEYIISDQQGNARVSFEESTTNPGTAVVRQENSYYTFGRFMPNSPVSTPPTDNKQSYNRGSEWQNDFSNLPDYYQTFYRNYDAALGRFVAADPMAEQSETLSTYNYAGNNPIMYNDPLGNKMRYDTNPFSQGFNQQVGNIWAEDDTTNGFTPDNYWSIMVAVVAMAAETAVSLMLAVKVAVMRVFMPV